MVPHLINFRRPLDHGRHPFGTTQVYELLLHPWEVVLPCVDVVLVRVEHDEGVRQGVRTVPVSQLSPGLDRRQT